MINLIYLFKGENKKAKPLTSFNNWQNPATITKLTKRQQPKSFEMSAHTINHLNQFLFSHFKGFMIAIFMGPHRLLLPGKNSEYCNIPMNLLWLIYFSAHFSISELYKVPPVQVQSIDDWTNAEDGMLCLHELVFYLCLCSQHGTLIGS